MKSYELLLIINFMTGNNKLYLLNSDFDTFLGRKAHIAILESHFLN